MVGFKPPLTKPKQDLARQLWMASATALDLNRIGIEIPEQMSALFVMDGEEIGEITRDVAPLTDFYPKRLSDVHPDLDAAYRFAYGYMESSAALRRFRSSSLIKKIWPDEWKKSPDLYLHGPRNPVPLGNVGKQLASRARFLSAADKTSSSGARYLR